MNIPKTKQGRKVSQSSAPAPMKRASVTSMVPAGRRIGRLSMMAARRGTMRGSHVVR